MNFFALNANNSHGHSHLIVTKYASHRGRRRPLFAQSSAVFGKLEIKPLATDLISGGMELRDKVMAGVESVKEDLEDVVAEAQVKAEERRQSQEAKQAAQSVQAAQPADSEAEVAPQEKTVAAAAG